MSDRTTQSALTTHDLRVGYGSTVVALVGDAVLESGTLTVLLGRNGAGKTTTLRTVAGLLDPVGGGVRVGSDSLHGLTARERARRLALVLSDRTTAGGLTAREVVALGRYPHTSLTGRLSDADRAVVSHALERTGAEGYAARPMAELSSGEQQRVFVARALAQDGAVVLLDEPTVHLDAPGRSSLFALLRDLARTEGRALLAATHELDAALASADHVWALVPSPDGPATLHAGLPEVLGLSGVLDRAFGVEVGYRAKVDRADAPVLTIGAEGADRFWAEHLARRLGFRVGQGGVVIARAPNGWRVGEEGVANLTEVAERLRQQKA